MLFVVRDDIAKVEKVDGTLLTGGGYATPLIVETSVILEILATRVLNVLAFNVEIVVVPAIVRVDPVKVDADIFPEAVMPPRIFVVLRLVIQLSFALSVPFLTEVTPPSAVKKLDTKLLIFPLIISTLYPTILPNPSSCILVVEIFGAMKL